MLSNSCEGTDWIELLKGASKFELHDLTAAIGDYLISHQKEWIQQNIITVQELALSSSSFQRLLDYCNQIMVSF